MSVKLRLRRLGRKKLPVYSLVAADTRSPRDGRYIEDLGRYEPLNDPASVRLNEDRILHWLREGAQPSDTVRNLLSGQGVMLRLHMLRKGKTAEEIDEAVTEFLARRVEKQPVKKSMTELRQERMAAERAAAAEKAKEMEKIRAEREAELEKQRQAAEDAERTKRAAADAEVIAEGGDEAADETVAAPESATEEGADEAASEPEGAPVAAAEEGADEAASEPEGAPVAAAEEGADEAAPEAVAQKTLPAVDEAARKTIAEAELVDPAPISASEAAAAEMVDEGAPVKRRAAVAPVEAETLAAESVADGAPAEVPAQVEPGEIPLATSEEAAQEPSAAPVVEKVPTRKSAPGGASAEPDNLTKIRGIGPKFSALLNEHGIATFAQLAALELEPLRTIVNESGISSSSANEESWPRQAEFLAADDKEGLKAFIDELRKA